MNLDYFHFIRPYWSLAILPWLFMLWLLLRRQLKSGNWANVCDSQLLPHILFGKEEKPHTWPLYIFAIASLLSIIALAGPTMERLPQPAFRDQSALVILLDLSHSMDATDIKPSRLIRARYKVADILKQRKDGQTALIVYAGDAFTITPLTDDTDTIASQLSILNTNLMPMQGSRADIAVTKATELFQQAGVKSGNILLITDEVQKKQTQVILSKLSSHKISVLGVGTEAGAPIPQLQGGFLKDANGAIVIPKLEESTLRELAQGGIYQRIKANDSDVLALTSVFASDVLKNKEAENDLQIDTWREQGPWLLLIVLPLAALAFRRGYLALLFLLFMPMPSPALEWNDLWLTQDQQASQAYAKEELQQAAELFANPEWKAASHYKTGQYEKALETLEGLEGADNLYNKGNALANLGRYPEAVEAYEKALELEPKHEDAKYNKELVEKQLEQDKEQNSQNQEDRQDSENKSDSQQDGQDSKGEPDSQNKESQDAQNSQNQAEQDSQKGEENESANSQTEPQESPSEEAKVSQSTGEQADGDEQNSMQNYAENTPDEMQQAHEQLLRKIPDDPGGLLRRKFKYQYQQGKRKTDEKQPW